MTQDAMIDNLARLAKWCQAKDPNATIWLHAIEAADALSAYKRLRELAAHNRRTNPGLPDDFVMLGDEAADRISQLMEVLVEVRRWVQAAHDDRDTGTQPGIACFNALQEIDRALEGNAA